jgi:hypothetical protein
MVAELPNPPAVIVPQTLFEETMSGYEPWLRLYHRDPYTPSGDQYRTVGPTTSRFDHQLGDPWTECPEGRGVSYLARELGTAASEIFGGEEKARVCDRWFVARVMPTGNPNVLNLTGPGMMAIGANAQLATGYNIAGRTQAWARAMYAIYPRGEAITIDGIRYLGAHDFGGCLALFESAGSIDVVNDGLGIRDDKCLVDAGPHRDEFVTQLRIRRIAVEWIPRDDCEWCLRHVATV